MNSTARSGYSRNLASWILVMVSCLVAIGCAKSSSAIVQSRAIATDTTIRKPASVPDIIASHPSDVHTDDQPVGSPASEHCTNALYWADEPLASQMQHTSAADLEQACADAQIACMQRCMNNPKPPYPAQKKGDRAHYALCHKRCLNQFMECMRKAGLLEEFSVLDTALAWMKKHGKEIVGTIVVIGGVIYIVSTAGSGALVLVVL